MGYSPGLQEKFENYDVWLVIAELSLPVLAEVQGMTETVQRCEDATQAVYQTIAGYRLAVKAANTAIGDLMIVLNGLENKEDGAKDWINAYHANNKFLPNYVVEMFEDYGTSPMKDITMKVLENLSSEIERITVEIQWADTLSNVAKDAERDMKKIWAEVQTGTKATHLSLDARGFQKAVDKYITDLKLKRDNASARYSSDKSGGGYSGASQETPKHEAPKPAPKSYSQTAGGAGVGNTPSTSKRWGDYSSSDEEEDAFSSMLGTFGRAGVSSKPTIEVPEDFAIFFPTIYKGWQKLCTKWQWQLKTVDCYFAKEGFIGKDYGKVTTDDEREKILSGLKDEERVNLNTFVSFIYSVLFRPSSIAPHEQGNMVSGYVTSLFLRDKYKDDEKLMKLMLISLKGSDAGYEIIRGRTAGCFTTGSKCSKVLFTAVNKMLGRLVAKSSDEEKTDVCSRSEICFTSSHGMMQNCYQTVSRKVVEYSEITDRKGKTKKVRKNVTRSGKDVPSLSASSLELNQKEHEVIRAKEESFNRLNDLITKILAKKQDSSDPLKTSKVVKYVVDLAYNKISSIRKINKDRKNAIRAKAQELAGDGNFITAAHWLTAKKELISSFDEIGKEVLSNLEWDVETLSKNLSLD